MNSSFGFQSDLSELFGRPVSNEETEYVLNFAEKETLESMAVRIGLQESRRLKTALQLGKRFQAFTQGE